MLLEIVFFCYVLGLSVCVGNLQLCDTMAILPTKDLLRYFNFKFVVSKGTIFIEVFGFQVQEVDRFYGLSPKVKW